MKLMHKFTVLISILIISSSAFQFLILDQFFFKNTKMWLLANNNQAAQTVSDSLAFYFNKAENSLRMVALDSKIRQDQTLLDQIRGFTPEFDQIVILDKQGNIVLSSGENDLKGVSFATHKYFQQAIHGETYISGVYTSAWGEQVIAIALPIIENGNIEGIVVGIVQLYNNNLAANFNNKSFGLDGFVAVVDEDGNIIYHADKARIGKKGNLFEKLQGNSGMVVMPDYAGEESYIGYYRVATSNWLVMVSTPASELIKIRNKMMYESILFSMVVVALIIILGFYIMRVYTKPIDRIIGTFHNIQNGVFKKINPDHYSKEFAKTIQIYNDAAMTLENINKDLKKTAELDVLTGAYNRRSFDAILKSVHKEIKDGSLKTVGILMMDLDFFKQINDTQGHLIGDAILQNFVAIMHEVISPRVVFRFGGDEFAILARNISVEEMLVLAENIRVESEGQLHGCTVSIGIATYPKNSRKVEDLLSLADQALYISKKTKNKITEYKDTFS